MKITIFSCGSRDDVLTVGRLLTALAETETSPVIAAVLSMGRLIRAEDGLEVAIRLIEQQKPHLL